MNRVLFIPQLTGVALVAFTLASASEAQQQQPYQQFGPGQPMQPPPGQAPAPNNYPPPPQQPPPGVQASGAAELGGASQVDFGLTGPTEGEAPSEDADESERTFRKSSLSVRNGLGAAAGLLRISTASAGAPGTFRTSFIGSWFSDTGFLCNSSSTCPTLTTEAPKTADEAERVGAHFAVSATVLPFLEAYLGLHNSATSNSRSRPQLLQVLGDTNFGAKAFLPWEPNQIFTFGGEVNLLLLNGTGGVGLDGGGTSFGLRGLASLDLSNQAPADQVPLSFHTNLGYLFDNSANLVEELETQQPPAGRGSRITRIERYGLDVNRVDSIQFGLGAEFIHPLIRPFLEWSIDFPANRQDHICNVTRAGLVGDRCLGRESGLEVTPSRLGLGAGLYPWEGHGLGLTAAVEIATGGSSKFIEEIAPESPWNLYFGLSYAYDTRTPKPIIERIPADASEQAPATAPRYVVNGLVLEKGTQNPIVDAIVRYEGRDLTAMVSDASGRFRTADLDPGSYSFAISASGYRDGKCSVTIQPGQGGPGLPAPGNPNPFNPNAPPAAPPPYPPSSSLQSFGNEFGMPAGPLAQMQPGYGPAPTQPGYGPAPTQPGYGPLPIQPGYGPAPTQPGSPAYPGSADAAPPALPISNPNAPVVFEVQCELEALPKVGNLVGMVLDGDSQGPVAGARVKIQDKLGRELELSTDAAGSFRFENVVPGRASVSAEAEGYMLGAQEFEVRALNDVDARITLNKRPLRPNVVVTTREMKLGKPILFQRDSAQIVAGSLAVVEEVAALMNERPDIKLAEVQGHMDNTGVAVTTQRLSQERAEAVVAALVRLGVERDRLEARGYGQEKPLVPNTTEANQAKNQRIQIMLKQR